MPIHHAAAPGIQDYGDVQEARPGRQVGDVGYPEPIRALGTEVALNQIGSKNCRTIPHGGGGPLAPTHAPQAFFAHQTSDPLAADVRALGRQLGVDPRRPVGTARILVNALDAIAQHRVLAGSLRSSTLCPRVEAAARHTENPAHGGNRVLRRLIAHVLEGLRGVAPVSCANHAAAFFNWYGHP